LNDFYNRFNTRQVLRPDPEQTSNQYTPDFISNLGPYTDSTTYMGALAAEVYIKSNIGKQTTADINSTVQTLKTDQTSIKNALSSGRDTANSLLGSVDDALNNSESQSNSAKDQSPLINLVLLILFVPNMAVAGLGLVFILLSQKKKGCNKGLHFSWCCLALLNLFFFLLSVILFPLSVVLQDVCDVVNRSIQEPAFYNKTTDVLGADQKMKDMAFTCLHSTGDILSYFDVETQLGYFNTIFTSLDAATSITASANGGVNSTLLPQYLDTLNGTKYGKYVDGQLTSNADLSTLNGATSGSGCDTTIMDTWVFNDMNCSSGVTKFSSGGTANQNAGSTTCLGFNEWGLTAYVGSARYGSYFNPTSCSARSGGGTYQSWVSTMVNNFKTNRAEVWLLFGEMYQNMTDFIDPKNDDFMGVLYGLTDPFTSIKSTMQTINSTLYDSTNGILTNAKCVWIGNSLRTATNNLCVGLVSSNYQTAVCLAISAFFSLVTILAYFCLAKRNIIEEE